MGTQVLLTVQSSLICFPFVVNERFFFIFEETSMSFLKECLYYYNEKSLSSSSFIVVLIPSCICGYSLAHAQLSAVFYDRVLLFAWQ